MQILPSYGLMVRRIEPPRSPLPKTATWYPQTNAASIQHMAYLEISLNACSPFFASLGLSRAGLQRQNMLIRVPKLFVLDCLIYF
jgi:hypothetical protein